MLLKNLVLIAALCPTTGFAVLGLSKHPYQRKQSLDDESSFMLKYRVNHEEDGDYTLDTSLLNELKGLSETSTKAFLPTRSQEFAEKQKVEQLLDLEIIAGRLAMTAAVVLFSTEILNGKSIPEQIIGSFVP